MGKLKYTLLTCLAAVFLISCQKELSMNTPSTPNQGGTTGALQGNWKFIGLHSKTLAIVEVNAGTDVVKTVTTSEYTTIKNTGTLVIDATNMTSTNLGYEVDAVGKGLTYQNNVLIDSLSVPFTFVAPPSSSVSPYTKVSSDSLNVGPGQFMSMGATTPVTTQPVGVKLKFQGDKLLMFANVSVTDVQSVLGMTQTKKQTVNAVFTYQKQ